MIPYTLFSLKIRFSNEELFVSAENVLVNGFSFLLPQKYQYNLDKISGFEVFFFENNTKAYLSYEINGYIKKDNDTFVFTSDDEKFLNDFNKIKRHYLEVVDSKLKLDELTYMELNSNVEVSDFYTKNTEELVNRINKKVDSKEKLLPVQIGICLDNTMYYRSFMDMEFNNFLDYYFKNNHLDNTIFVKYEVSHIYIGNQFCEHLLLDNESLIDVVNKVLCIKKTPVIVFPPMKEGLIKKYEGMLICLKKICDSYNKTIEIVVNDFGLPMLVKKLIENKVLGEKDILITSGILLNKRKKDPRIINSFDSNLIYKANETNLYNNDYVVDELCKCYGISAISYEGCGYRIKLGKMPSILHIPLYETNSSSCVLCRHIELGPNNINEDTFLCNHLCEKSKMFYSEKIPLIGIGNTVFGISDYEINSIELLNEMIIEGVKRIVLRFI